MAARMPEAITPLYRALMILPPSLVLTKAIEIPFQKVPILTEQFIYKARSFYKPIIVATQMLESMNKNPLATRAEVSDVYLAVMEKAS